MLHSLGFVAAAFAAFSPLVSAQVARISPVYGHDFEFPLPIPPVKEPSATYTHPTSGVPIDFYEIKIKQFTANLFPDLGDATLIGYDGIAPGPTFRVKKGRETVVRVVNEYFRPSSVHLHGSYSRAPFDGWAADTIQPGEYKDYYYPNSQDARTLWYHDHAQGITALNAYSGQAGFYIIEDDALESQFDLPRGAYEIPLMMQSRLYTSTGNISDISADLISTYGDTFSVNGQILPHLVVEPRKYRFRMLNAAASRSFNFTIENTSSNGTTTLLPMAVVGSDAGFMSRPVVTENLVQAMAERWDVVVDFAGMQGRNLTLTSKTATNVFVDTQYEGTGAVMQFRVGTTVSSQDGNGPLPETLVDLDLPTDHATVDQQFRFGRTAGVWTINGQSWANANNRVIRNVPRGTTEKWQLIGGNGWSHPVHIHLVDFQILSRTKGATNGRAEVTPYEAAALKDVVTVGAGETVTVLAKYGVWDGVYMFHCHNLIHEDHDMMLAFNVTALPDFGYPEKTRFLDPMEERFRAKTYAGTDLVTVQEEILPAFAELEAYANVDEIEEALDAYHAAEVTA